jgi:hypothetical protein
MTKKLQSFCIIFNQKNQIKHVVDKIVCKKYTILNFNNKKLSIFKNSLKNHAKKPFFNKIRQFIIPGPSTLNKKRNCGPVFLNKKHILANISVYY